MKRRKGFRGRIGWLVVLLALTIVATAQQSLKAGYFTNAHTTNVPDAKVVITDPDVYGGGNGNMCAMIYVFDVNQEISECCGCMTTPDGERELSVNADLTSNPLIGILLTRGTVRVVSNPPNSNGGLGCDPTKLDNPQPELLVWGTHPARVGGPINSIPIAESAYADVPLSEREAANLPRDCHFVMLVGSSRGICSCGTGD